VDGNAKDYFVAFIVIGAEWLAVGTLIQAVGLYLFAHFENSINNGLGVL